MIRCGDRLDEEHPLPAVQPGDALEVEDEAGDRRADDGRDRDGEHEQADDAGAIGRGEPQRQEEDDAGEEAGLGDAEQQAHDVEAEFAGDERLRAGDEAPGQHDAGDPDACAEACQARGCSAPRRRNRR